MLSRGDHHDWLSSKYPSDNANTSDKMCAVIACTGAMPGLRNTDWPSVEPARSSRSLQCTNISYSNNSHYLSKPRQSGCPWTGGLESATALHHTTRTLTPYPLEHADDHRKTFCGSSHSSSRRFQTQRADEWPGHSPSPLRRRRSANVRGSSSGCIVPCR
jgi:hypothetical protein